MNRAAVFASPVTTELAELVRLQSLSALVTSRKRRSAARQQGAAPSKQFGRGLDFAEVREYHAGDEVRLMDWNVTARIGRPHIKVFMEERERPVLFVVDQTSGMHFGTRGMFKSAMAVRLAGLLAWCALSGGDRIGGVVAQEGSVQRIKPAGQRRGLLRLLQALASKSESEAQPVNALKTEDALVSALQQVRGIAPSGSRVVLISDFQTITEALEQEIQGLMRRVEMMPICISDAIEHQLPTRGVLPIRSRLGEAARAVLDTGASAQREHAKRSAAMRERVDKLFSTGGQTVTHVQSHDELTHSAMRAWFGVQLS